MGGGVKSLLAFWIGGAGFFYVPSVERTWRIPAEDRTLRIAAENRVLRIA